MRGIAVLVFVVGCSAHPEDGRCTYDGAVSAERIVSKAPVCNGSARARECAAEGLPSAYGVDGDCAEPYLSDGETCRVRSGGTAGCVALATYLCCP